MTGKQEENRYWKTIQTHCSPRLFCSPYVFIFDLNDSGPSVRRCKHLRRDSGATSQKCSRLKTRVYCGPGNRRTGRTTRRRLKNHGGRSGAGRCQCARFCPLLPARVPVSVRPELKRTVLLVLSLVCSFEFGFSRRFARCCAVHSPEGPVRRASEISLVS